MKSDAGEIKKFDGTKTPIGWNGLPEPGTDWMNGCIKYAVQSRSKKQGSPV